MNATHMEWMTTAEANFLKLLKYYILESFSIITVLQTLLIIYMCLPMNRGVNHAHTTMVYIILHMFLECLPMFHWAIEAHSIMIRAVEDEAIVRLIAGSWRTYRMIAYQSMMERFRLCVFIHELAIYTFVFKSIYYTFWCSVLLVLLYVLRAFYQSRKLQRVTICIARIQLNALRAFNRAHRIG